MVASTLGLGDHVAMGNLPHRKLVKHPVVPGIARELTFSCYRKLPLLANDEHKRLLTAAIDSAMARNGFELVAFVYMPDHVHLIVFPVAEGASVSDLLYAIKKPHSARVRKAMEERGDGWLDKLMIRERPGKTTFRFWQEGSGYDRQVDSSRALLSMIEYVHANPVRKGLCNSAGDWPWSSWHSYHASVTVPDGLPVVHGLPEGRLLP